MKQQINLYVKKVKQRLPFSARLCLVSVSAVMLVVIAVALASNQQASELRQQTAALKQQQKELEAKTSKLLQQKRPRPESASLRRQHDQLQQKLVAQQRLSELLRTLAPQGSGVFSPLLSGLSDKALGGVWLTRIQATSNASMITLEGKARNAELIPKYLKQLGEAEAYHNASFDQFELKRSDSALEFRISGSRSVGGGA
ncbi:MAG: PilN domain-containing protein [Motiliproteus sp.]